MKNYYPKDTLLKFTKMHGIGNDFVVIDAINQQVSLTKKQIQFIANRNFGVGCDQILLVEKPSNQNIDFKYRIFNADGSEVAQCGNGARCFARFVRDNLLSNKDKIRVETNYGKLLLTFVADDIISVDMGVPKHAPKDIPIKASTEVGFYAITINNTKITFGAVSIGNPHAVIQVDNINVAPVIRLGSALENHPFFPNKVNIGFMQIINRQCIKLRVYERGLAETLSCGSGACAAVVIGIEHNLLNKENICVKLPGGELSISWLGRGQSVFMTGTAESVFEGQIKL